MLKKLFLELVENCGKDVKCVELEENCFNVEYNSNYEVNYCELDEDDENSPLIVDKEDSNASKKFIELVDFLLENFKYEWDGFKECFYNDELKVMCWKELEEY